MWSALMAFVFPDSCCHCAQEETLLCSACRSALAQKRIDPSRACPYCGAPFGSLACTQCNQESMPYQRIYAAYELQGVAWSVLHAYKDLYVRRYASFIAQGMAACVHQAKTTGVWLSEELDGLVYIPDTKGARLTRGFDHMQLVADELALLLRLEVCQALVHVPTRDQRRLDRHERQANSSRGFEVLGGYEGRRVLLIDDVTTTGSTLSAATCALQESGVAVAGSLVFARAG